VGVCGGYGPVTYLTFWTGASHEMIVRSRGVIFGKRYAARSARDFRSAGQLAGYWLPAGWRPDRNSGVRSIAERILTIDEQFLRFLYANRYFAVSFRHAARIPF